MCGNIQLSAFLIAFENKQKKMICDGLGIYDIRIKKLNVISSSYLKKITKKKKFNKKHATFM